MGACGLLATQAAARRTARVGYLYASSDEAGKAVFDAFRDGLRESGWVEGTNLTLMARFTNGTNDQLAATVAELLAARLDVVVGGGSTAAEALAAGSRTD